MTPEHVVYFSHGKESGPWGTKIMRLAQVARLKGFAVHSPDYSTTMDPDQRVAQLLALRPAAGKHLVLVGSSMGAYVSLVASAQIKPAGLFLLAPAVFRAGYQVHDPKPYACSVVIVHGENDELIDVNDVRRYAQNHHARLHVVPGDHRLISALPQIEKLFADFLDEVLALPCNV